MCVCLFPVCLLINVSLNLLFMTKLVVFLGAYAALLWNMLASVFG